MRILLPLFFAVVLAGPAGGQDPAPQPAPVPNVVLPVIPTPRPPVPPPPPPGDAILLKPGYQYVITATDDVAVLTSPNGVLSVTNEVGPLRISGYFIDGKDARETRTYSDKKLYIIEPTGKAGSSELLVIRSLKDRTKDLRQVITTGEKPPDPPDPIDPPKPDNPIPSDKLRVLCVWDTSKTPTAAQNGVMNSTIWKADVTGAGGEERVFSKDTNVDLPGVPQFWKDAMKRPKSSLPYVIISSPKGFWEGPLPATVADMQAQIKKVGG